MAAYLYYDKGRKIDSISVTDAENELAAGTIAKIGPSFYRESPWSGAAPCPGKDANGDPAP